MTGSSKNGSANSGSIRHALSPRDDRETLSALFDGALPGDAVRFALKRLDHDADWRETSGRWQLIGDALRGQATAAAPADFAGNVMRALADAQPAVASATSHTTAPAATHTTARWRWMGGAALAATVAMAAVLVVRPFSQSSSSLTTGPAASASVVAPANTGSQPATPSVPRPVEDPASPVAEAAKVAAVAATTEKSLRRSVRSVRNSAPAIASASTTAMAATAVVSHQPFHPPSDEIVTRPWPRAVLPETNAGALTVGFGTGSQSSSSFYPFEPRLPAAEPQSAGDPQR